MGCPNGLLFDNQTCVILRDGYTSLDVGSFIKDGEVSTHDLLARVATNRPFDLRVLDWLQSMASSWNTALPTEGKFTELFTTDIVPAISGSLVHEVA